MKKIILLLTFLLTIIVYSIDAVSANWLPIDIPCTKYNATTINVWTVTIPKFEGIFQYCAKQELLENPYAGWTIVFNGSSYLFTSPSGTTTNLGWSPPNQAQFRGNYIVKAKIYKFDKTPPNSCTSGTGTLYYWSLPAVTPLIAYTWAWTNQEIFWRVSCTDWVPGNLIQTASWDIINIGFYTLSWSSVYSGSEYMTWYSILSSSTRDISWCEKSFYDTDASHGVSSVLLTLKDNAWNTNTNNCSYNYTVLKDAFSPIISVKDQFENFLDDITDSKLATDSTYFVVRVEDIVNGWNAVSGIKNYSAMVTHIADYLYQPITPEIAICDVSLNTFPITVSPPYTSPDEREFTIICDTTPSFQKTWVYRIQIQSEDNAGNIKNFETRMIVYPHPDIHIVEKPTLPTPDPVNSDGIALHTFNAQILDKYDNPVYDHNVNDVVYTGSANIYIDEVNGIGNAVYVKNTNPAFTSPTGVLSVHIASIAPGELPTGFGFNINKWTDVDTYLSRTGTSEYYGFWDGTEIRKFLRPYTTTLTLDPSKIILGYIHTGSLGITRGSFAPAVYTVHNFLDSFLAIDPNMVLSYTSSLSPIQVLFTPEQVGGNILDFKIKTHPDISYIMSGTTITSYATPDAADTGTTLTISGNSWAVNRIYIIWNKHTYGKDGYVSTISDIATTPTIDIKNTIRKNATIAVRGRTPNLASDTSPQIVRGIKYISWDYVLGGSEAVSRNWETLIVTDGNVTVDTELFNTSWKPIAIIVLSTKLNNGKGNLFIKPQVRYIGSLIYTDESIESVDSTGARFVAMNKYRSDSLSRQLVLNGVFISRNTIGWAVKASNDSGAGGKKYTLPGNIWTDDLFLAARFDLAFLRSSNDWYATVTQPYNLNNNAFTVVVYDGNYLQSPPPGFSTRP